MTFGTFRGWPFHAVCVLAVRDGEESPRPGRVPPRAMICCLEMCQYWICMPVYGGDFWELVSMFNTKVHALLFSVSRSLRNTGWGRYLQATDFLASALGSSFGREFLLRRGRVSWNDGIWFFTFFPSYFIRIVREKKKGEKKENRSKSDKIPSSMYFLRLLGDLGDFSLTRRNKGRKEKMMVDEDISAWRGEESREKNIISRVSKEWSRRETEISLNIA